MIFNQNVLILWNVSIPSPPPILYYWGSLQQNVSIPLYCILRTQFSTERFNTSIFYTTSTHFYNSLINTGSISFFSSFDMHLSHHLLGCHPIDLNSSFNIFLSSLRFSKFICLAESLIRIMVSGSYSSKLLILILLISVLRTLFSLQENMALPESSLKQCIFPSAYKAVKSYLIILLVTNQLGISFNVAIKSSTAHFLSFIFIRTIYH